jgi:hypothetical protein
VALPELSEVLADIVCKLNPYMADKSFVRYWHFDICSGKYPEGLSSIAEAPPHSAIVGAKALHAY